MSLSPDSSTEVPTPIMTDLSDIASMIQINEEATVSRTVMHAEGVRLVLFSFDKGEILSEHTAAMPVILHTIEGALEIEADGRTVVLRPGDVIHFGACPMPCARSNPRRWRCTCWIAASAPRPERRLNPGTPTSSESNEAGVPCCVKAREGGRAGDQRSVTPPTPCRRRARPPTGPPRR